MKIAIHQPNFMPWIGFFRKLYLSDLFVLFDDVQFEKGGYINRVKVKLSNTESWLTQPITRPSGLDTKINQIIFSPNQPWRTKHIKTIGLYYRGHPYFDNVFPLIERIYLNNTNSLGLFNAKAIKLIAAELGLATEIVNSSDINYTRSGNPSEKVASIVKELGGDTYISGNGAKAYNDEAIFIKNNIALTYDNWTPPSYNQSPPFVAGLSIIDMLFNVGVEVAYNKISE
ncbi:MAG: WbqC family protein [Betaproteobacteria bacterium]